VVHKGMYEVVNEGGTGSRGRISYAKLCAKTGTAQWGPKAKQQRLAWFAGFMPYDTPRYAFAALYEGSPGQRISGGSYSGPIVSTFFNAVKDDIEEAIKPPPKAVVIVDPEAIEGEVLRAIPVDPGRIGVGPEEEEPEPEGILRAIPVELDPEPEEAPTLDEPVVPMEPEAPEEEEPSAPRALPVDPIDLLR